MLSVGPQVIEPIADLMLQAGYSETDVRNVLGGNWFRVFQAAAG
jgi:microsomal dipeptidase-like Zn-dependent dipeptidase